jgi:putative oxidoreductase
MDHTFGEDVMDFGLLIARVMFGTLMAAHGAQKLFGWFGGYGLTGTGGFFEQIGFRPGRFFAAAAGLSEGAGGLLLALGLFEPAAAALVVAVMIVAAGSVHWPHGLFAASNGIELPLLYGASAAALALTGPGAYSLDAAFGLDASWTLTLKAAVLLFGVVAGVANLALRRPLPVQA